MIGAVAIGQTRGFPPPAAAAPAEEADAGGADVPSATSAPPRMSADAEARFRGIVDSQFDFIWRSLRGLGVPAAGVDDAAQQVFLVAAQKIDAIAPGSERSFLFTTARGIAANVRRARTRSREVQGDDAFAEPLDAGPDPEQLAASKQARELLDRLLDGLPEELRTVFVLFELE